ncbi:IS3 family transposase [Bradyrhizobium sp. 150]|nr:IS3 family transposase [Bradyrhizobium sp. 150]
MEGRQRRSFTDDYKRQAVDLVASSGRSVGSVAKELGLRDSVLRRWVEPWGPAGADGGGAAPHNTGDAAAGGPRGRGCPFATRERAAAHGARHFKNNRSRSFLEFRNEIPFHRRSPRRLSRDDRVRRARGLASRHAWRARPESRRSVANRDLVDDIKRVHRDAGGRYGSPRIHAELRAQRHGASRGRIERLMRRQGIRAILARPRGPPTAVTASRSRRT